MNNEERNIRLVKRLHLDANIGDRCFHNGVEYVDLDLPSGIKWATMNIGAKSVEDYGLYFQCGDTQGYTKEQIENGENNFYDDSLNLSSNNMQDVGFDDDAAHVNLGGNWRLPTKEEVVELIAYTSQKSVEINGIKGCAFINKKNAHKWIFIPFGGFASYQRILGVQSNGHLWSSSYDGKFRFALSINDISCNLSHCEWLFGHSCRGVLR